MGPWRGRAGVRTLPLSAAPVDGRTGDPPPTIWSSDMRTVHRFTATVALAGITLVGGATGASAMSASPPVARLATTSAAPTSAAFSTGLTASSAPSVGAGLITSTGAAASSPASAPATVTRNPLSIARSIISVISRFGGWLTKLASAVNRGYTAYRDFINSLPWYISYPVKAISPLLLAYDVWSALNSLL